MLAKVASLIGEAGQLDDGFQFPKNTCLTFPLRPEGMDMTMVLHAPKRRLAMDIANRSRERATKPF